MTMLRANFVGILIVGLCAMNGFAQPSDVMKTNPMKVYMHYMPWFETPATLGGSSWGYHWRFNNRNPNIVDATGKRQIASHYYPLIGPYASRDPDVIEYHLLLMKLSGVDGLLIDWYGVQGTNSDIEHLLTSSNAIIDKTDDFGLKFGVVLEDRFSTVSSGNTTPDIEKGKANMAYLRDHYFNNANYIRQNSEADPLVGVFGPITFQTPAQWTQILAEAGEDVDFNTLWYEMNDAGANADGEYAWIYEDENLDNHLMQQSNFYRLRAPNLGTAGGVAYPGFNDYYAEGGVGNIVPFEIPHNSGQTLDAVLGLAEQYSNNIDFLQLATFNDFGEGTMFEPTIETGFDYLKQVQQFTGVPYGEAELQLVYRLYLARKKYAGNALIQENLNAVANLLAALDIPSAIDLLSSTALAGDYDADGDVDAADYSVWRAAFDSATVLFGSGADGNYNGVVDVADYVVWRKSLSDGVASAAADVVSVPEPAASAIYVLVAITAWAAHTSPKRKRQNARRSVAPSLAIRASV
ncbi:MAG TPA: glycoside hydrolase family 71/99-like protein [Lacipirellulaceae bacterium]|nr:glycoside hydrolase family 71/99-like protein [Lacipirellulaceae bacterium]